MLKLFLAVSLSLVFVNGQDNQVCFPVPSVSAGPPGPPGPRGPPGEVQECECNDTETRQLIEEQQETIDQLTATVQELQAQGRLIKIDTGNGSSLISINCHEVRQLFAEEWRKKNNCPIGVSDGRISDSNIKSSSVFNNESAVYGAQFGRLDNQPDETNIGAWRPYEVPPITILSCGDAFYSESSYRNSYSNALSSRFLPDLVQIIQCPKCDPNRRSSYSNYDQVYGTTTYTDVSAVCYAAIHAGEITGEGGIVTVRRQPRKEYISSTRHHIHSRHYQSQRGSFQFESNDALQWIQVDMQNSTLITGVVTQGRPTSKEEWVKSFKIKYGETEDDLQYMRTENGTDIVFEANNDRTSHVTNMFLQPIEARVVRLVVISWHNNIALRLEYLTC